MRTPLCGEVESEGVGAGAVGERAPRGLNVEVCRWTVQGFFSYLPISVACLEFIFQ